MRVRGAVFALVLLGLVSCIPGAKVAWYEAPKQHIDYTDPGELALRDELLTLPFKYLEWDYKFPNDRISRVTVGLEHLYLETPNHAVIAVDRFNGETSWKFHVDTQTELDWQPVESDGVPQEILELEEKLRKNKRAIDDTVAQKGPGPETEKLWKERNQYREQLKVAHFQDNVYFISQQVLYCLDRRTGNQRWKRRLTFAPSARPYAIRNLLFVASADLSRVWVLNVEKDGQSIAFFRSSITIAGENHITNQPVYSPPTLFFVSHDGNVYAYDVGTRREKWRYSTEQAIKADPTIHTFTELEKDSEGKERLKTYNLLFVGGMDNAFYAIDADGGVLRWKYECGAPFKARAVAKDRTVFVKSEGSALYAFDVNPVHRDDKGVITGPVRSGKMRWKLPLGERFLLKGRIYVYILGPNRNILAVDEMSGSIRGRYPTNLLQFLVTNTLDDYFYAVHPAGYIFALREQKGRY